MKRSAIHHFFVTEPRAELAAWKAEQDAAKAQEDSAFATEWDAMPRAEQDELLDLWWQTSHLLGTAAGRFLARSYRKKLSDET